MESFIPENVGNRYEDTTAPTDASVNTLLGIASTNVNFVRQGIVLYAVSATIYCRYVRQGDTAPTGIGSTKRDFIVSTSDEGRYIACRRGLDVYITSTGAVNIVEVG